MVGDDVRSFFKLFDPRFQFGDIDVFGCYLFAKFLVFIDENARVSLQLLNVLEELFGLFQVSGG